MLETRRGKYANHKRCLIEAFNVKVKTIYPVLGGINVHNTMTLEWFRPWRLVSMYADWQIEIQFLRSRKPKILAKTEEEKKELKVMPADNHIIIYAGLDKGSASHQVDVFFAHKVDSWETMENNEAQTSEWCTRPTWCWDVAVWKPWVVSLLRRIR